MAKNSSFLVDLKVNRNLLDPKFDGYKLSLESLVIYDYKLEKGVDCAQPAENQYSYQHARAFALHNHLFSDSWLQGVVYVITETWDILKFHISEGSPISSPVKVFCLPQAPDKHYNPERYNVTMSLPAEDLAILSDGSGAIYLLQTGNRQNNAQEWKVIFETDILGNQIPFSLLQSVLHSNGEDIFIECALVLVLKLTDKDMKNEKFETHIEWITLFSADRLAWSVQRRRCLVGNSWPDYIAFEHDGEAVDIVSAKSFRFISDSLNAVAEETGMSDAGGEVNAIVVEPQPAYTWSQDEEFVTAVIPVSPNTVKSDISFNLTCTHVDLKFSNSDESFLGGELFAPVDVDSSKWIFSDSSTETEGCGKQIHVVELYLRKREPQLWSSFIPADKRGRVILNPQQLEDLLKPFTSDVLNPNPERSDSKPYNTQELEECDMYPDDQTVFQRFHSSSHQCTHQINLGSNQWLYNVEGRDGNAPALCLRHDVDGLVWQPTKIVEPNSSPLEHVATFNAFGYVQASKSDKKFSTCPPSFNYVAICETSRRVYIYYQPNQLSSSLRNRKSGRQIDAVAKQQVITLKSQEPIVGCCANMNNLVVLAKDTLYAIKMQA